MACGCNSLFFIVLTATTSPVAFFFAFLTTLNEPLPITSFVICKVSIFTKKNVTEYLSSSFSFSVAEGGE